MPRGYRCVIVAAVGWLILSGADHPNPPAKAEQGYTDRRVGDALANISATYREQAERAARPPERQPCGPHQYKSTDDLCAQWKAADAAADAAWWAQISGVLSVAGLLGVAGALFLTIRSNHIARDTARRQLRAYMSVHPKGIYAIDERGDTTVPLLLVNNGQTPAYHVEIDSWFSLQENPVDFDPSGASRGPRERRPTEFTFGPGEQNHVFIGLPFSVVPVHQVAVRDKKLAIVHYGTVTYEDAFGEPRTSDFAFYHRGEELSDVNSMRCRRGNHST